MYNVRMLNRINISTDDKAWARILSDLGARVTPFGIKFAPPAGKISAAELSRRVDEMIESRIAELGAEKLSDAERGLTLLLPGTAAELKAAAGYAESSATHTVETLVYNIRKKMGADFIKLENGQYKL